MSANLNYKTLAVDPGSKRIGLAICDELALTTRSLPVINFNSNSNLVKELLNILTEENCRRIVIGLPLNIDGSFGESAKRSKNLAKLLTKEAKKQNAEIEIILWDERLTTFEAEQRMREMGFSKKSIKGQIDSLAAQVLLEDYLESLKSAH